MQISMRLNGQVHLCTVDSTHQTLSRYLRAQGLTGTKEGCAEGDCGACSVLVRLAEPSGTHAPLRAINSCIAPLALMADREVWTVESLAQGKQLHPVQASMVKHLGSQCGYCTPGFVMNMAEGFYRPELVPEDSAALNEHMQGNLCRCTGYRPIRDALVDALRLRRQPFRRDMLGESLEQPATALRALSAKTSQGQRFDRPTSLGELLELRRAFPHAVLVAGATEVGVEANKKFRRFEHLVATDAVPELRRVEQTTSGLWVGGAVTLTELEESLGAKYPSIRKVLAVFASRQIRHRATVAGNLVTASPIGDLAPVLLCCDATLELASYSETGNTLVREVPLAEFFRGYRKTLLDPSEVVLGIRIPAPPSEGTYLSDAYKVSKRRELDISIVLAAFAVHVDAGGIVLSARVALGGVAATPTRLTALEQALVGQPWTPALLQVALPVFERSLRPISDVRGGAAFRKSLVASLFQKFVLGVQSEAQDAPLDFAPVDFAPVDSATSSFESDRTDSASALAQSALAQRDESRDLDHESGRLHVTGRALYVDDEAERRGGMLELWPVLSPHAYARVHSIDVSRARDARGVVAVLLADDVPGSNDVGAVRKDEPLLAADYVHYVGQIVAVVAAETLEAAREAADLVSVDYEVLSPISDVHHALARGSYHTEPHRIARGNADQALEDCEHRLTGSIDIGGQEHFYLETQAAWAEVDDSGHVIVHSSTQHPSEIQAVVSHVLHLPRNQVVVESPRMGGGFGGKETQGNAFAALVALCAHRTGRAARIQLDRDLDMTITGKRHPFAARFEVGFQSDGTVTALRVNLVSDGGWALDLSESILDRALFHLDNAYYVPHVEFVGRVAKTNRASNTAFRGFGGPQGMLVIEDVMARVAAHLGLPAERVRQANFYSSDGPRSITHYGQPIERNRIHGIWERLLAFSEFQARRREIDTYNAGSSWVKRGLAITPVKFGISFTASFLNQAGALVLMYRDGTVQVNHGGTEMGQGLYTKIQGIAMRELGLPSAAVRVMKTRTDKVPNTSATAASAGADLNGAAVQAACIELRSRLTPIAKMMLRERGLAPESAQLVFAGGVVEAIDTPQATAAALPISEVAERAYLSQVNLSAQGFYRTPGIGYDRATGYGRPFHYFAFGAAVAEVELDGLSGMKRVRRVDIVHDVGATLHGGIDRGQIEGGFIQGMGWLTGEELKWSAEGALLTHSASTYAIPSVGDTPATFRVELLPIEPEPGTVHGSKAVGEPPLMLALSVREAIRDAISAFGSGGVVSLPSPLTHEVIFQAVAARLDVTSAS
ncbi:MAG: xanthine dehydrogenase molybdopterin binding subunit [Kofleriaceae bacterium]|nr:xanthine dehydrogenase molybdopterin binding subunit [Kofleriaceae bacterium]